MRPTDGLATLMLPNGFTVTAALALAIFGELAVIVADPTPVAVTWTATLVAPGAKLTIVGTVATPVLFEATLIVKPPAGACPLVKLSVRFPWAAALSVRFPANCITGAGTFTVPTPDV